MSGSLARSVPRDQNGRAKIDDRARVRLHDLVVRTRCWLSIQTRNVLIRNELSSQLVLISLTDAQICALDGATDATIQELRIFIEALNQVDGVPPKFEVLEGSDQVSELATPAIAPPTPLPRAPLKARRALEVDLAVRDKMPPFEPTRALESLERWFDCTRTPKSFTAIVLLYGLKTGVGLSPAEVGKRVGRTREWVRLLTNDFYKSASRCHAFFEPLMAWMRLAALEQGGLVPGEDLMRRLFFDSSKRVDPSCVEMLKGFRTHPTWLQFGLVWTSANEVAFEDSYEHVVSRVKDLLPLACKEAATESISRHLWSAKVVDVKASLLRHLAREGSYWGSAIPTSAWEKAVHHHSEHLVEEGDRLFSKTLHVLRYGRRVALIETLFALAPRGLTLAEVQAKTLKWRPGYNPSISAIVSLIGRCPDLILWGQGAYIHRQFVLVPQQLLSKVGDWCTSKINTGLPYISVAGVYETFKADCLRANIPTYHALYALLSEQKLKALRFPHYPAIQPANSVVREPVAKLLENFVRSAGGYVPNNEVRRFALEELLVNEALMNLHLYRIPNVIRSPEGVIHIENVGPRLASPPS